MSHFLVNLCYRLFCAGEKAVLHIIKHRVVLNDGQVLGLGLELLVGVLAGATEGVHLHLLSLHLLGNLAGSFTVLASVSHTVTKFQSLRTIVASEQENIDKLQTENAKKVPTDTRHPSGVHVMRLHTSLKHALELDGDGEGEFHYKRWLAQS